MYNNLIPGFIYSLQVRYLSLLGGNTLKQIVDTISSRLISDELGVIVSYIGRGKAEIDLKSFKRIGQLVIGNKLHKGPKCVLYY